MFESIWVTIIGDVEDAKQAIKNSGYGVGEYEVLDVENHCGNLEVDDNFIYNLKLYGEIELDFNGTTILAEWPWTEEPEELELT